METQNADVQQLLDALQHKYESSGQDWKAYLQGLLQANFVTYWDYIRIDTLLSLQQPRTDHPDEYVFICYHQITELYFKLVLHELDQIRAFFADPNCPAETRYAQLIKRLGRINSYFKHLSSSFEAMVFGMDQEQFLQFRMALLPASGFQSAQYRKIEFALTDLDQLLHQGPERPDQLPMAITERYPYLYWKYGNIELKSGKKTLTLRMFEEKYDREFIMDAQTLQDGNVRALVRTLPEELQHKPELHKQLRALDAGINLFWRLSHYKSAVRYLQRDPEDIAATGGTNWQKYLPPRFQRIFFYPEVWTEEERREWGKAWVLSLFEDQVEKNWTPLPQQ